MAAAASADLARLVERCHAERCLAERVVPDTEVHHDPDVTWVVQPLGSAWRNAGIEVRLSTTGAPAKLDAMLARYGAHRRGMGLWVSPAATPADLPGLLRARRLRCRHYFPAMARRVTARMPARDRPVGLEIRPVENGAEFARVPHPGIGPPTTPMRRFALSRLQALVASPSPPTRAFVAWLDGRPVGAVELFLGREAAGLHDLSVLEGHRGRGIGAALVDHVCAEARHAGRDTVVLLATTDGEPLYARRGFEAVAHFGYYYRAFKTPSGSLPTG